MNNVQALDQFRDFGNAVRPAVVLAVCLIGGVTIGKNNDAPVEGMAGGIITAAMINGVWNWWDARKQVGTDNGE